MIKIDDLECCGIFSELNERELAEVAKVGSVEKRGAGSRVIKEGMNASGLYLIQEGRVAVRMTSRDGHEVVIDELGTGDVFGWSAVLQHQVFKAAVWTLEDSKFIILDGRKLGQLFDANNHIAYRVVREIADVIASRLERLRARLVDQPFSEEYLVPPVTSTVPATGEKSEMRSMDCPECSTKNTPMGLVNETEQYRCKKCGMIYYSPVGCETGPVTPSATKGAKKKGRQLGDNWSASTPAGE